MQAKWANGVTKELQKREDRIRALEAALRPFAAVVYNDNGDLLISHHRVKPEHWLAARTAYFKRT